MHLICITKVWDYLLLIRFIVVKVNVRMIKVGFRVIKVSVRMTKVIRIRLLTLNSGLGP